MSASVKDLAPLRLIIGSEDLTGLLDNGWTCSNVDPGGFEAASFAIPKDLPQTLRGQYVRLDSGLRVAFEGRVSQVQRSLGSRTSIVCEGYGALLKDNAVAQIFVDRDFARWQGPSVQRQIDNAATFNDQGPQAQADPTAGNPALACTLTGPWGAAPGIALVEGFYDAQGIPLSSIYYAYSIGGNTGTGGSWVWKVLLSDDDRFSGGALDDSGNLSAASSGTGTLTATTSTRKFAAVEFFFNGANAVTGPLYALYWKQLAVYGRHGLTGRGSNPVGFYPSDIFGWVISQTPGLQSGVVQQTDASNYILPHSAYLTPVTLDTIVNDMAVAQGWHWGVWESQSPLTGNQLPRADFRPRPASGAFTAFCRRQDCDQLDIREDLEQQFDTAIVTYNDVTGVSRSVAVTTPNPILQQAGINGRDVIFNGGTMTSATATIFAAEALAILNQQARIAGSADILAPIDAAGPSPAWLLKAGIDRLRIADAPSVDAYGTYNDYPISRVEATGSSNGIATTVEFGSGSNLIETMQARLASATALAGQGG